MPNGLYVMEIYYQNSFEMIIEKLSKAAAAQVDCLACSTNRKELTFFKPGLYGQPEVT